jgi:hypothetical protein
MPAIEFALGVAVKLTSLTLVSALIFSSQCAAFAQQNGSVVIQGTIMSVHDRLPPIEVHDIVLQADFKFNISGDKQIDESWTYSTLRNRDSAHLHLAAHANAQHATLGEDGSAVTWHVQGAHRLERITQGRQFVLTMSLAIDDQKNCKLTARYVLQKGKTFVILRRADNGEDARFSVDRVTSATCSVQ